MVERKMLTRNPAHLLPLAALFDLFGVHPQCHDPSLIICSEEHLPRVGMLLIEIRSGQQ